MKNCNSCGKCCIKYGNGGLSASAEDLQIWETQRPDIYRYTRDGDIWKDPESGQQIEHCPWLQIDTTHSYYTCAIYFDRPEDCRLYPATIEDMIKDDCEMLEASDLRNLKQAKKDLNMLMLDHS